jgi:hypothetical protein
MDALIQFIPSIILAILLIVPCWRIVARAGFHPAWSLLALVPIANVIALWIFAKKKWPALEGKR